MLVSVIQEVFPTELAAVRVQSAGIVVWVVQRVILTV